MGGEVEQQPADRKKANDRCMPPRTRACICPARRRRRIGQVLLFLGWEAPEYRKVADVHRDQHCGVDEPERALVPHPEEVEHWWYRGEHFDGVLVLQPDLA